MQYKAGGNLLRKLGDRIQARAVSWAGELLKEFDGKGNNQHRAGTVITQKQAKSDAGMSEQRAKTAVRVAAVLKDQFEAVRSVPRAGTLSWHNC